LVKYSNTFPKNKIPHISEAHEIVDMVHKNRSAKADFTKDMMVSIANINDAFFEIATNIVFSRLIGLVSHFVYWHMFGYLNQMQLSTMQRRKIFLSIQSIILKYEEQYKLKNKKLFTMFYMPLFVLTIRVETDLILHRTYKAFYSYPENETIALQKMNFIITKLLDPNIYYSRFSYWESGKEAIDKVFHKNVENIGSKKHGEFYTSSLIAVLVPMPTDGKLRSLMARKDVALPSLIRHTLLDDAEDQESKMNELANKAQ